MATSGYIMNHTMIRIKDPKRSLPFYTENLGMKLLKEMPMEQGKFTLYFLGYGTSSQAVAKRSGILELTHNWGAEDSDWKAHSGNLDPKGFGHICISVDNLELACSRLESMGCKFQKKPNEGNQSSLAFVLDPDEYWVEMIERQNLSDVKTTDLSNYRFNHSMIRIKEPERSQKFYSDVLGMKLLKKTEQGRAKFTIYFYGYDHDNKYPAGKDDNQVSDEEGLVELTWNWGTEKDDTCSYASGNEQPSGFGHLAITVDNIEEACERFEQLGVPFKKKLLDGQMKDIAFIQDPDGYWIEVLPKSKL